MKIFIVFVIFFIASMGISFYVHHRKKWIASALVSFTRLVFFTVLMRQLNNNEELKYSTSDLYDNTLRSNTIMIFMFWCWDFDSFIEDKTKFIYLTEVVLQYRTEFDLYWAFFVTNGIDLTADNIIKYNSVIKSDSFKRIKEGKKEDESTVMTLH